MHESLLQFRSSVSSIFNNQETDVEEKLKDLVHFYIDVLTKNSDIPYFVLHELRTSPQHLISKLNPKEFLTDSIFLVQMQKGILEKRYKSIHPLHLIMNVAGLVTFPFLAAPLIRTGGKLTKTEFEALMKERKTLIPQWIRFMLYENLADENAGQRKIPKNIKRKWQP
jgi:hypothetical protein